MLEDIAIPIARFQTVLSERFPQLDMGSDPNIAISDTAIDELQIGFRKTCKRRCITTEPFAYPKALRAVY